MSFLRFLLALASLSAVAALMLVFVHQWAVVGAHARFSWLSLGFFVLLTLLIYAWAYRSARSNNPKLLLQVAIGVTAFKIAACIALVWGYVQQQAPQDHWFLLPFFSLYLLYTIFETHLLMRFSRLTPNDLS